MFEIFFSLMRMYASSSTASMRSGIGDEVRREVAAVELHALDDFERRLGRLALLDRDDAFLADLLHRLGEHRADLLVAVGADGADLRDLLRVLGRLGQLLERLDDGLDGLVDAALDLHRVVAGRDELACPRGRSPGRARSRSSCRRRRRRSSCDATSRTICAPMFSKRFSSSISLATVTPSLVTVGRAEALLDDDVAALGAEGDLHRVGERVDAGEDQVAGVLGVDDFFGCHCDTSS